MTSQPLPLTKEEVEELREEIADTLHCGHSFATLDADLLNRLLSSYEARGKALEVFGKIKPSDIHPPDGSGAEPYVVILQADRQWMPPDFTGADLALARSLTETEEPT